MLKLKRKVTADGKRKRVVKVHFRPKAKRSARKHTNSRVAGASRNNHGSAVTDSINIRLIQRAGRQAAERAMHVMGYVVVQQGDKIVKKFSNGTIKEIEKLAKEENTPKNNS